MSERARLPNRRPSETFELESQGIKYRCTFARYALAEIFIASGLTEPELSSPAILVCGEGNQFARRATDRNFLASAGGYRIRVK
jgi:hypothetical protein